LADLPEIAMQTEPHDVNRQGRPHLGEATLKNALSELTITRCCFTGTISRGAARRAVAAEW
jgi:hypothetical protein